MCAVLFVFMAHLFRVSSVRIALPPTTTSTEGFHEKQVWGVYEHLIFQKTRLFGIWLPLLFKVSFTTCLTFMWRCERGTGRKEQDEMLLLLSKGKRTRTHGNEEKRVASVDADKGMKTVWWRALVRGRMC